MRNKFWETTHKIDGLIYTGIVKPAKSIKFILKSKHTVNYFWYKLLGLENDSILIPQWFTYLYENNYIKFNNSDNSNIIWLKLRFVEKCAECNRVNNDGTVYEIIDTLLRQIINNKKIQSPTIVWLFVKIISKLPNNLIKVEYINYICKSFNDKVHDHFMPQMELAENLIPKTLIPNKNKEILLLLYEGLLHYRFEDKDVYEKVKSVINDNVFDSLLVHYIKDIAIICGVDLLDVVINKIKNIVSEYPRAFYLAGETQMGGVFSYEDKVFGIAKSIIKNINGLEMFDRVNKYLNDEIPVINKLAIVAIKEHYDVLNKLFWNWCDNPLQNEITNRELFLLLQVNKNKFSTDEINKFLIWVKAIKYDRGGLSPEEFERNTAGLKKRWLSSLLPSSNESVANYYNELEKIDPSKPDHQFLKAWSSPVVWGGATPLDDNYFKENNLESIVAKINILLENADVWTKRSLLEAFKSNVKKDPNKYILGFDVLKKIDDISFVAEYYWAIKEIWVENGDINWDIVFNNISETTGSIVKNNKKEQLNAVSYIGRSISQLIRYGAEKDEHCFDIKYYQKAKNILIILCEYFKDEYFEETITIERVIERSWNSTKGEIYRALIILSLFKARAEKQNSGERWDKDIENIFTSKLTREDDKTFEYSVIVGSYLPNILYLNKKWISKNIKYIFPRKNKDHFISTMTGYLTHYNVVYKELYEALKVNNIYSYAIKQDFKSDMARRSLIGHICLAYNEGWDNIADDKSLISKLIKHRKNEDINEIIQKFWQYKKEDKIKIKIDVIELWQSIIKNIEKKPNSYKKTFGKLIYFLSVIDDLNEKAYKLALLSVGNKKYKIEMMRLLPGLQKHVQIQPLRVGRLLLRATENGTLSAYEDNKLLDIIETLYKKNNKVIANRICDVYGENGLYFVKQIYYKHNK